jgi:site-specific recombinase XerD
MAENWAQPTVHGHVLAVQQFTDFALERSMPTRVEAIAREHCEMFVVDLLERWSPATAAKRFLSLRKFFAWCEDEGEITTNPMAKMRPPYVPETVVHVVPEDDLRAILKACSGKDFRSVCDLALLTLMIDTGLRLGETAGIRLEDVDRDGGRVSVLGKGRRWRTVGYGAKTGRALDRYVRARARHRLAHLDALWLGLRGPLGDSGITQALATRCEEAGVARAHPHQLRHSFARAWLASGGHESDLMTTAGWRSRVMLNYYGRSVAAERAQVAAQRNSLDDRL